ncbi:hypothetical protein S14_186 [Shewanella sp. phage 1/4]|uniref:hypothetical protein n=1 Tax=Shewanella phage 1/4 TaxID=1458859 RepID=UPI0004F6A190|nr:hypothetical protein S14_186 [Shewanella sp. phage 1/4]AHK11295.1 hypothetical protein S14_186 [Shewanella sp. phage 1/4]
MFMAERRETKRTIVGRTIQHKLGVTTIREFKGSNGLVSEFIAECSVCSLDTELWPYGSLIYDIVNINRDELLCGCSRSVRWKDWQIKIQIDRILKGGNLTFCGFEDGLYEGKDSKIILYADGEPEWKISIGNLRKQQTPVFSKSYKENLKIKNNLQGLYECLLLPDHYNYSYDMTQKKYQVSCSICDSDTKFKSLGNKLYPSKLDSLKVGRKPCRCSPTYKFCNEERLIQIEEQIQSRGLTKVRIPEELNSRSRIIWVCKNGHVQDSKLNDFVKGSGCFECGKLVGGWYGYYPNRVDEEDNLYLIKFTRKGEIFYKVGRSFNVKERIRKMTKDYEMELVSSTQNIHQIIYDTEQELHQKLNSSQHYVKFYFEGCVGECFTPEILNHPEILSIFNL